MGVAKTKRQNKTQYVCSECGSAQMKWLGKCPECGEWNTLEEVEVRAAAEKNRSPVGVGLFASAQPVSRAAIPEDGVPRLVLANNELNRVLGGGIVKGLVRAASGQYRSSVVRM